MNLCQLCVFHFVDEALLYSTPRKNIDNLYRPLPNVPSTESKQSGSISGDRQPVLCSRNVVAGGDRETNATLPSPTIRPPTTRCPINPDEPLPPLPARMPTKSQNEASDTMPPPLPERQPDIHHSPTPRAATRTPLKMPPKPDVTVPCDKIPSDMIRNPSPRERRELRLPSISTLHVMSKC